MERGEEIAMAEKGSDGRPREIFVEVKSNWARSEKLRPQLVEQLQQRLLEEVPKMVSRLGELEPIITHEVGEYIGFMQEAQDAFQFRLLAGRAVDRS